MLCNEFTAYPTILMEQWVGTGKSQTMAVCEQLVLKGKKDAYMTGPTMRDLADEGHTLFCDDFFRIDGMVSGILKTGYQKGATMEKKEWDKGAKAYQNVAYNIYGPKMVSTNKPLEYTITDRMLRLQTQRSPKIMPQVSQSDPVWEKGRADLANTVLTHWDAILSGYASFNGTVGSIQLVGREVELWRPLLAIGRAAGLGDLDPLAGGMVKDARTRNASQNPEYMLLDWLENEIAKGTYRSGYAYLSNDIDAGVRGILDPTELTFWNGTQPGTMLGRLLDYPSGFPRFKAGSGKGRLYYTDPQAIGRARARRPL
jgi:hypothetical protein